VSRVAGFPKLEKRELRRIGRMPLDSGEDNLGCLDPAVLPCHLGKHVTDVGVRPHGHQPRGAGRSVVSTFSP
jgi:hypothetical protein